MLVMQEMHEHEPNIMHVKQTMYGCEQTSIMHMKKKMQSRTCQADQRKCCHQVSMWEQAEQKHPA